MPRYNINNCRDLAYSKGGKCLSLHYKSNITKMKWECKEGHIWETTFKIIKKNSWCPTCNKIISGKKRKGTKNNKLTIQYCRDLAKQKKGECLSEEYKSKQKLLLISVQNLNWSITCILFFKSKLRNSLKLKSLKLLSIFFE